MWGGRLQEGVGRQGEAEDNRLTAAQEAEGALTVCGGGGRSFSCSSVIWLCTTEHRGAPPSLLIASLWSTPNVIQSSLLNRASRLTRQQRVAWSLSSWSPFNHRCTPWEQGAAEAPPSRWCISPAEGAGGGGEPPMVAGSSLCSGGDKRQEMRFWGFQGRDQWEVRAESRCLAVRRQVSEKQPAVHPRGELVLICGPQILEWKVEFEVDL